MFKAFIFEMTVGKMEWNISFCIYIVKIKRFLCEKSTIITIMNIFWAKKIHLRFVHVQYSSKSLLIWFSDWAYWVVYTRYLDDLYKVFLKNVFLKTSRKNSIRNPEKWSSIIMSAVTETFRNKLNVRGNSIAWFPPEQPESLGFFSGDIWKIRCIAIHQHQ